MEVAAAKKCYVPELRLAGRFPLEDPCRKAPTVSAATGLAAEAPKAVLAGGAIFTGTGTSAFWQLARWYLSFSYFCFCEGGNLLDMAVKYVAGPVNRQPSPEPFLSSVFHKPTPPHAPPPGVPLCHIT